MYGSHGVEAFLQGEVGGLGKRPAQTWGEWGLPGTPITAISALGLATKGLGDPLTRGRFRLSSSPGVAQHPHDRTNKAAILFLPRPVSKPN